VERLSPSNAGDDEMKTTIELAREVELDELLEQMPRIAKKFKAFEALVRADERNSWPAEMEAMERQVNILTDALAAEREACAKVCDDYDVKYDVCGSDTAEGIALQIRARGNT
jgi:hypothetical protein